MSWKPLKIRDSNCLRMWVLCGSTFALWTTAAFVFMVTWQLGLSPVQKVDPTRLYLGWILFAIAVSGWAFTLRLCCKD